MEKPKRYVLLDDDDKPVRYFSYQADGTVEVVEPKYVIDWNNYEECLL
jgi:hypothetical protein